MRSQERAREAWGMRAKARYVLMLCHRSSQRSQDVHLMCIWVGILHPKMAVLVDSVRVEGSASFG